MKKRTLIVRHIWFKLGVSIGGIFLLCSTLFLMVPRYTCFNCFTSLVEIERYAKSMPEYPRMDNTNMVRPDYTSHHRSYVDGFLKSRIKKIGSLLWLYKGAGWTPEFFETQLSAMIQKLSSYKMEGDILYKMSPKKDDTFIVFGDLSGAFHSLVIDCIELKKQQILDDNLKIIPDNTKIIFMGDAISRSAYGLETLSLIFRLMQENEGRVIYLRGNHEDMRYWEPFGMQDQIMIRLPQHADDVTQKINQLFSFLPLGLYFSLLSRVHSFVRISHLNSTESTKLDEGRYASFLNEPQKDTLDRFAFSESKSGGQARVEVIIASEKKRNTFQTMDGLRLLEPDRGATSWTLLSCPTPVVQKGLHFYNDAFAIINAGEQPEQWAITLHYQDARKRNGFLTETYQFFTGKKLSLKEISQAAPEKEKANLTPEKKESDLTVRKETSINENEHVVIDELDASLAKLQKATEQMGLLPFLKKKEVKREGVALVKKDSVATALPTKEVVSHEKSDDRKPALSVTVTPPVPGGADQSTVIAIKIPPTTQPSPDISTSKISLPKVESVVR